jgi:hypothetical protein
VPSRYACYASAGRTPYAVNSPHRPPHTMVVIIDRSRYGELLARMITKHRFNNRSVAWSNGGLPPIDDH